VRGCREINGAKTDLIKDRRDLEHHRRVEAGSTP
jgi:hypothetical protein